jgi:hypothetical protein
MYIEGMAEKYLKIQRLKSFQFLAKYLALPACSASLAFSPAQANCLSLGDINSSQLV